MNSPRLTSLKSLWNERSSLTRKMASRRELDKFFAESVYYLRGRQCACSSDTDPLSDGIAAFAFKRFGALASNVLRHWGINSPDELEESFRDYLRACGSVVGGRSSEFSQSEALKALFRGEYWP